MLPINPHSKPQPTTELEILHSLYQRMHLSTEDKRHYNNLYKGFKGEMAFYNLLKNKLTIDGIILFDLLLNSNNTEFQIDSLGFFQNKIYLFEVKNFKGDFYIKNDRWYTANSHKEIRSPLPQLQRTEYLLRHLLHKKGYNLEIKPYIIFINNAFTLYQASLGLPIIFPTQLERFIAQLNSSYSKPSPKHPKLPEQMTSMHLSYSSHSRIPMYNDEQLKRGILCKVCRRFLLPLNRAKLTCKNCNHDENVESAVIRSVYEYNLLFPDKRITTSSIHKWCNIIDSKKTIRRILSKNLIPFGKNNQTHYIFSAPKF